MLIKRNLQDCLALFDLMIHPDVYPFVREKADSYEEYLFVTKQIIEKEEQGELISRTILDEWGHPIGVISLYDIHNNCGFLGTWLGKPFHGKGYNKQAKNLFLEELFFEHGIDIVFMRVRKENIRSLKAIKKLPYACIANETHPHIVEAINNNQHGYMYDLYAITKDAFILHTRTSDEFDQESIQPPLEA